MKKLTPFFIVCLFIISTAFQCEDDDGPGPIDDRLEASWDMTSYISFGPSLPEFQPGDVVWTFDFATDTLTVENNLQDEYPYLPPSGTYLFSLSAGNLLSIAGMSPEAYRYAIENNVLTLEHLDDPQIADDELVITFDGSE